MNERVFIIQDEDNKVVAVYNDENLANKMLPHIKVKLKSQCTVVSKMINADLSIVGNDDVNK